MIWQRVLPLLNFQSLYREQLHLCRLRNTHRFCTLNNLIFLILINNCEEKLALWYIVKCDSTEGLFTDYFCLIIWYSTGSCLSCYYFCKGERGVNKPLFFRTFHSVLLDSTGCSMNIESIWIMNELALLWSCNLK